MKFGFCAGPGRIAEVADAGFDYIELPVSSIADLSEADFRACRDAVLSAPIPAPAFNVLFPGNLKLLSEEDNSDRIRAYLEGALNRVRELGGRVVVFGSGASRFRPEALPYGAAFRRLAEVTRLIGEVADRFGITIAVEPLNRGETNIINSLAEGACLAAAADHPRVKVLADYYHVSLEGEPVEEINRIGRVAHVHLATTAGRRIPLDPRPEYSRLFSVLKQTGYEGLISVEGRSDDLAQEGPLSLKTLRQLWEEAREDGV